MKKEWCIPKVGAEFVWRMEDVLDLYAEPLDSKKPVVCFDERPCQLMGDVVAPVPTKPARVRKQDYEYKRKGNCNLFVMVEPLGGWRNVEVTDRRTSIDFAHQMKALVDEHYPRAEVIRIVLDNLSSHTPAALHQAFPPEGARRLTRKLEFHYTPKHGSWLNMAEIEISVLARQCLRRRIADKDTLRQEIAPWQANRNRQQATIQWNFSTADARTKLNRLYPS